MATPEPLVRTVLAAARFPGFLRPRGGNAVRLWGTGPDALLAFARLVEEARTEVVLACYMVGHDEAGLAAEELLARAARRGVSVRVLVDGFGSLRIALDPWPRLREAGGRVEVFGSLLPFRGRFGVWQRDHRKFLVVDGARFLLGGMNIAREYGAAIEERGIVDRLLEGDGPAAVDLVALFEKTWHSVTGEPPGPPRTLPPPAGDVRIAIEGNARLLSRHRIFRTYREAIQAARTSIVIENPYFLPGSGIRRLLRNAVKRGVRVVVVLPEKTDARLVDLASRATWGRLLQAGVELHIDPAFLHAKLAVFDERQVIIGSCNLDRRSLQTNLEVVAFVAGGELARDVLAAVAEDLARARKLELEEWRARPKLERWLEHFLFGFRALL